jgi:predicted ATPase/tRNA A-37 threonylcarbamoyl transferase component Bud32
MPEKDWEKVKDLFHDALRLDTSERESFLDQACDGDIGLRIEVESLLMSLTEAKSFLEMPVIGEPGESKSDWHLENGRQISHYRIIEPIGSGGMSEVYLADDERLGRKVALKVLPREMLNDRIRLRRFQREANAVSALNHPNILTIFEFEQDNGVHFFASEFVNGMTLRKRLDSGKLKVIETLEIAIQIASALQAAHDAGVVHRDIKPENVMIRVDGYVKVLDFGLAKLTEKVTLGEADRTLTQRYSLPGMIMGTVTYMSPEQARGTRVDPRSDIFSLGIVLFEMLTGRPPFRGDTATDVLAEIIQTDPPPPGTINKQVPAELDDIVTRSLEKNPANRFQSTAELVSELKSVLKRLEFNAELENSADNNVTMVTEVTPENGHEPGKTQTSLPDGLSPLVGRVKEIADLTDLMASGSSRLVTLTGIGGTGKTRLAQEICRRLGPRFRDGFVFVRLGEVRNPARLPMVIARQAGVQEIVGTPISRSLADFLENRHLLLVLDNFEQIMDAAPLVAEMLSSTSELTVLVTSRERLNVQAEHEYNVPPLPVPDEDERVDLDELSKFDSVRLFVERSQQGNPNFQLSDNNAAEVAKICSRLDGLPLAIELAAARTRIFSPATILEKLEGRLAFLTGGARDLPERQQTMRAAVDWSYDLLNDDEKRLFRRLSVFACQFTASAAETVAWDKTYDDNTRAAAIERVEFLDVFASLADKSLLIRRKQSQGETTYGLLEIVREYAESVLAADDDEDEIRLRHAKYYLALAEKAEPLLLTRESADWIRRLEGEHDNLRAALRWSVKKAPRIGARLAAAIRQFWMIRGHLSEGLAWSQEILGQNIELLPAIKWKLLTICGNISQFQGDVETARRNYEESLSAARLSGKQNYVAQSLRGLGALAYVSYDLGNARNYIHEALAISRNAGDEFGTAAALARLGDIANVDGDLSTSRELTRQSLEIMQSIGYSEGITSKLYNLGAVVFLDGDSDKARLCFKEALLSSLEIGEKINTRLIFDGFAALAAEQGNYARAAKLAGAADSIGATIGYTIEPAEQKFRDAYIGKLRLAMQDIEFAAAYETGRKLKTDEAVELAYLQAELNSESEAQNGTPRMSSTDTHIHRESLATLLDSRVTMIVIIISLALLVALGVWLAAIR